MPINYDKAIELISSGKTQKALDLLGLKRTDFLQQVFEAYQNNEIKQFQLQESLALEIHLQKGGL